MMGATTTNSWPFCEADQPRRALLRTPPLGTGELKGQRLERQRPAGRRRRRYTRPERQVQRGGIHEAHVSCLRIWDCLRRGRCQPVGRSRHTRAPS